MEKSQANILIRASSSLLCLNGSIGLVIKLPIEFCCCGILVLTAAWMVVGAAAIMDAIDMVTMPAKAFESPAEEVLLVETAPAAAGPPSSLLFSKVC